MANVYRNLHKPNHFSILEKGKVVGWGECIQLFKCHFHINENGRKKVTLQRKKGVHAWVTGSSYKVGDHQTEGFIELWYDPYYTTGFMSLENGCIVKTADTVICKNNRCYAKGVTYEPPAICFI